MQQICFVTLVLAFYCFCGEFLEIADHFHNIFVKEYNNMVIEKNLRIMINWRYYAFVKDFKGQ